MEVFQVQRIIHNLFNAGLKLLFLSHLKLKTEYHTTNKQDYINPLSKTRNIVFKNNLSRLFFPWLNYVLHQYNLSHPRLIGSGKRITMIVVMKCAQNSQRLLT